jgi:uncharacterized protein YchJ
MRSRYSAYARKESDYLVATHPYERNTILKRISWARSNDWQKLEVLKNTVEFKAYFRRLWDESNSP